MLKISTLLLTQLGHGLGLTGMLVALPFVHPLVQLSQEAQAEILPGDRPGINTIRQLAVAPMADGVEFSLEFQTDAPVKFTNVSRGNTLILEIASSRIRLRDNQGSFHRNDPAPGIASATLLPLDQNTSQLIITGSNGSLSGNVSTSPKRLSFKVIPNRPNPVKADTPAPLAPAALPQPVPPVVSDLSGASLGVMPNLIKLGTSDRIPTLVLRTAPVRDVLSLLAMTAGLNTVFLEPNDPPPTNNPNQPQEQFENNISLEIRNESIENVFNYILQVAKLQAKLDGKTILIGRNLPPAARGFIVRTVRLNQLKATQPETLITNTSSSDATLGSGGTGANSSSVTNSKISRTSILSQKIPIKGALQILEELGANGGVGQFNPPPPGRPRGVKPGEQVFNGIQVSADSRTNAVTLVGDPNQVQLATDYLKQLDVRKRQVSVNVKIVEVELSKNENLGASFSFGVNDSFFAVTGGEAAANFGTVNPTFVPRPSAIAPNPGSLFSPDIVQNPLNSGGFDGITRPFQFPSQFLLNLQARILSNDAKILTDPTLIVQEGSSSQVNLTTQVFAGFRTINQPGPGNTVITVSDTREPIDVGVILNINVEQIDDNGFITMAVSPEVSSPGQTITDPSRNNLLIQQLVNRRRLDTGNLRLRDGQTLVLAGIISESDRTVNTKTPILGDIPLLGALFRSTTNETKRNEVIVLVTPKVID
ncbi:MAG: secretin N-terminal domain-containing protein [Pseudanabaenaceae cyanobacterium bins.68]|nr:secretin N-terminal domain-containing protein [Pseudanabaenaceae cyanobacterium bins.68]